MKILIIHNFYQSTSPSGEDLVFEAERILLKERSKRLDNKIKVITYEKKNDEINNLSVFRKTLLPFRTIWSQEAYKEIKSIIKKEKPDIAHFHNIWYLISPSGYYACKEFGVPVVQTLHNFRVFCVNGLLMRKGKVCERCIGRLPWRAVKHGCYRDSRLHSLSVALTEGFHNFLGTWGKKVDAYIALIEFTRKKFIECGIPEKKIFIKPNFLLNQPEPSFSNNKYAVFLGRLSVEKGLETLIDAFNILQYTNQENFKLKVIGDGPLLLNLKDKIRAEKVDNIEFVGRKNFIECMEILRNSLFMVIPSIWYETFSIVVIEAFACGKPVIASRIGALQAIVNDGRTGLLFEPGNSEDLAIKIKWMLENEDVCVEMGKNARVEFEEKYTAKKNYQILIDIYQKVIKNNKNNNGNS